MRLRPLSASLDILRDTFISLMERTFHMALALNIVSASLVNSTRTESTSVPELPPPPPPPPPPCARCVLAFVHRVIVERAWSSTGCTDGGKDPGSSSRRIL